MSEDIRVYWDHGWEIYTIIINNVLIIQDERNGQREPAQYSESTLCLDELVYDSVEDSEFKLIDDNLAVPDVIVSRRPSGDIHSMRVEGDISFCGESFWESVKESEEYHEGKEWTA
mgnify:CR=1 FL=1